MFIVECWGRDPYCPYASDVWAVGVILTNMVSGGSPWEKASLKDRCFARHANDPQYLYNTMPISEELHMILLSTFVRDPSLRVTLPELRQMILSLDTFFRSTDEKCFEATCSNPHVNKLRPLQIDLITDHRSLSQSIPSIVSMTSSDSPTDWEDESRYSFERTSSWTHSESMDVLVEMRKSSMDVIMSLSDNYLA